MTTNNCLELSITENNDETFDSYSLLFDKAQHNFSTSSEISFLKHDLSTTINNISTEDAANFNPWLLLFVQDDQQQIVRIHIN
jgi:hypothetical protein